MRDSERDGSGDSGGDSPEMRRSVFTAGSLPIDGSIKRAMLT
jgi:hypothetical protein